MTETGGFTRQTLPVTVSMVVTTWIRREFPYFRSKLPENPVFAPKYLQQSLDFSQS
jgi:hypothetical protein